MSGTNQVTIQGFDNIYGIHLGKNPLTVLEVCEKVHTLQKQNPDDELDRYGLTPEQYEFKLKDSEEVLEIDYIVSADEELVLYAKL